MAGHSADTARAKHIDVACHFVRQQVHNGVVRVQFVPTDQNLSDLLTKPLAADKFVKFRKDMGMT